MICVVIEMREEWVMDMMKTHYSKISRNESKLNKANYLIQ